MEEVTFKLPKLDHGQERLHKAFGLNAYQKHFVKTAIVFEVFSNHLLSHELYDDIDEAPSNMTSTTGILEKSLDHLTSNEEKVFALLIFSDTVSHARHGLYSISEEAKKKQQKDSDTGIGATIKKLVQQLQAAPVEGALEAIKKCDYDFQKFVDKVIPASKAAELEKLDEEISKGTGIDLSDFLNGEDPDDE